ncbi:MAG: hypothetical protein QM479_08860 [Pseudomonadota bacterium]
MNANNFNKQPSWVQWFAQDANGDWWGFEVEALQNHQGWYENEVGQYIKICSSLPNLQWRKRLIKRCNNLI